MQENDTEEKSIQNSRRELGDERQRKLDVGWDLWLSEPGVYLDGVQNESSRAKDRLFPQGWLLQAPVSGSDYPRNTLHGVGTINTLHVREDLLHPIHILHESGGVDCYIAIQIFKSRQAKLRTNSRIRYGREGEEYENAGNNNNISLPSEVHRKMRFSFQRYQQTLSLLEAVQFLSAVNSTMKDMSIHLHPRQL